VAIAADPWPGGAVVYTSKDEENFELNYATFEPSIVGRTLTELIATSAHRWSDVSLDVKVSGGELSSVSESRLLAGENLAAIRGAGSENWELFQYQYATLDTNGDYVLSRLLRGQYGTDAFIPATQAIGSEIVFLQGDVGQLTATVAEFGVEQNIRYGSSSLPISDENFTTESISYNGTGLRPFSPAHLRQNTTESGNIVLTWIRRSRELGDFWAANEVPLSETVEEYNVSIWQSDVHIRSATVNQPRFVYTLAEQAADGVMGNLSFSVSQCSEIFGLGPATRVNINV
jgi:hypothetical protein